MFPLYDDNPTLRTPLMTYFLIGVTLAVWFLVQGAGSPLPLIYSVCDLGMVPAELTRTVAVGEGIALGGGMACVVDDSGLNVITPLTSMFLHGDWMHLIGNLWFLWVFGNNIEDAMGRLRFLGFYLLCGLAAAALHVAVAPSSMVPTVGASGAISGVMGAYLLLHARSPVRTFLPPFFLFWVPAWAYLIYWFALQLLGGLPELGATVGNTGGVAFWAHVGGFVAGVVLIRLFSRKDLIRAQAVLRARQHGMR